ncbi:ABC transporter permease [Tahibacter soli]|uniref:ABC transporter permease n=1 Tax=Tahibacter soli TaxID=2983605 RepID=A0A9X4BG68_9GAMM|nr:ABC transporter permease [Tahibacter soli]MDC8011111.1 ABC transporter permease [Tahibacter soli]
MTPFALAWRSLRNRRATALVCIATIALGVAVTVAVERIRADVRASFAGTVSGIDLVVGARSGPLNLLLYSVFHIGDATNEIAWSSYEAIARWNEVDWAVPVALGDSHRGFRVVGTTAEFFRRYRFGARRDLAFAQGRAFGATFEAVVGADVAQRLGYAPGRELVLTHGLAGFVAHENDPFRIVGVLARTGTPVDAAVLVDLSAIDAIHRDFMPDGREAPATITAFFVGLKSRAATFAVQRRINDYAAEPLLAILPGVALQSLWRLVGVAENALRVVGALVVATGLAGMLGVLLAGLNERRREMAILRALGAGAGTVFALLVVEALVLAAVGGALGLALACAALAGASDFAAAQYGLQFGAAWPSSRDVLLVAAVVAVAAVAGGVPAALACRRSLADGLSLRL